MFLGLSQHGFNVFGYLAGFGDGRVAANLCAIARDEEFGEIPFDGIGEESTSLRFEILENGICFTTIYLNLVHDGEGDTIVELAGGFCITARAWFLTSKLVAGEPQYHQPLVFVLLVESLGYWSAKGFIRFDLKIGEGSKVLEYNLNNFQSVIDVNCYAIPREIAFELPKAWYSGWGNDRRVYQKLSELGLKGRGTGRYTVNYQIDFEKFFNLETFLSEYSLSDELKNQLGEAILKNMCLKNIEMHDYKRPWAKE